MWILHHLSCDTKEYLQHLAYHAIIQPIAAAFMAAQQRGEVQHENLGLIAGALVASIQAIYSLSQQHECDQQEMANQLVDIFIRGIAVD